MDNLSTMNEFVLPHNILPSTQLWRSLRVENLPENTTPTQLLNLVTTGMIEQVIYPTKNRTECEIRLMNYSSAVHLYVNWHLRKPHIKGVPLRATWRCVDPVPGYIVKRVAQGATRNVYISNLPEELGTEDLDEICRQYGEIESLRIKDRVAFIHYLSVENAMRAVDNLPKLEWPDCEINFGHDRCGHIKKNQKQLVALFVGQKSKDLAMDHATLSNTLAQMATSAMTVSAMSGGPPNVGNRTVYLSNLSNRTNLEDLCLFAARGGLVQNVRHIPARGAALITYLDPIAAAQFFATWNMQTLLLHDREISVTWAKKISPKFDRGAALLEGNCTRNIFIGNLSASFNRSEFTKLMNSIGSVAQIHWVENSCAFTNFADINDAVNALKTLRKHEKYRDFPVRFAKDRVGSAPKYIYDEQKLWGGGPWMIQYLAKCQQQQLSPPPEYTTIYSM